MLEPAGIAGVGLGTLGGGVLVTVPPGLTLGLALAFAFSVLAAVAFVVAQRVYGPQSSERAHSPGGTEGGLSSENRRRDEIREYLDAIEERYEEDHAVHGEHVAFFLPERDVAVTFDARTYFRFEGRDRVPGVPTVDGSATGPRAVLCEHEMHGHHLGGRLPFDVPDVELRRATADGSVVRSAFAALGLSTAADEDAVTAAYRDRVKDAHPDHGGTEAEFTALRDAYSTAKAHASRGANAGRSASRRTEGGGTDAGRTEGGGTDAGRTEGRRTDAEWTDTSANESTTGERGEPTDVSAGRS